MLNIFRRRKGRHERPTRHDGADDDIGAVGEILRDAGGSGSNSKRNSLRSSSSFCDEVFLEELSAHDDDSHSCAGTCSMSGASIGGAVGNGSTGADEDDAIFTYHSRLSISISTIVDDPNCLSYFVQYLEARNALSLIKFYLDIENFRTAAVTQLDKEQLEAARKQTEEQESAEPVSLQEQDEVSQPTYNESEKEDASYVENDDERNNSVPELKTLCDLSMHKSLTDDEKSQIYAQTNKQIQTKCNNTDVDLNGRPHVRSQLSLNGESSTFATTTTASELCNAPSEDDSMGKISATSIRDAIAIYQKYLITNTKQFVCLPVDILSDISLHLCKCSDDDLASSVMPISVSISCFDDAQKYVLQQLEQHYLNDFLQSTFYCKYCIDLIEGSQDRVTIYDILYSEVTLFFFMEFLEQHNERDCLDFWTTAINFRKSFTTDPNSIRNESEVQEDAMIIYEKFFSLQSDCRLWISERLRPMVEERICAVGHVAYCFDIPLRVTAKYLEKKYLSDFLKSQLFENYINELKTKINEEHNMATVRADDWDAISNNGTTTGAHHKLSLKRIKGKALQPCHRKTLSDCTNGNLRDLFPFPHISQHNTLLAAMDPSQGSSQQLKPLHSSGTNMNGVNIDALQLTNPNLLWHRDAANANNVGGLKFGRVNSLGRYERDFDAVDSIGHAAKHNWSLAVSGSKLKNAMRKLVNLPEEKMQEEIAWQVAEMIVKDVTNVTLHNCET